MYKCNVTLPNDFIYKLDCVILLIVAVLKSNLLYYLNTIMTRAIQYYLKIIVQCVFIITSVYTVDAQTTQIIPKFTLPNLPASNCIIGYYYRRKCDICECVAPGVPKCRTTVCADGDRDSIAKRHFTKLRRSVAESGGCAMGKHFSDWCQLCHCAHGDTNVCSKMGCHE